MARPSMFGPREGGERVQGVLTKTATQLFERARRRLAEISGWDWGRCSDADVIEFLARGEADTRAYFKKRP